MRKASENGGPEGVCPDADYCSAFRDQGQRVVHEGESDLSRYRSHNKILDDWRWVAGEGILFLAASLDRGEDSEQQILEQAKLDHWNAILGNIPEKGTVDGRKKSEHVY